MEPVSPEEWQQRVDLAAAYRLVAHFGWDDLIFTHLTARVPGPEHEFLINPYGMLFEEITASSLVKVDLAGKKLSDSPYDINPAGYVIHSSIHAAREDAQSVMHVHSIHGVAISAQKNGVLPISQQSTFVLASLGYHDYEGVALRDEEKAAPGARPSATRRTSCCATTACSPWGPTVAETFLSLYLFDSTCRIQVAAQAGSKELIPIEKSVPRDGRRAEAGGDEGRRRLARLAGPSCASSIGWIRRSARSSAEHSSRLTSPGRRSRAGRSRASTCSPAAIRCSWC